MKDVIELRKFYHEHRTSDLVLCTLVGKTGSSYRSVFAKKLIDVETSQSEGQLSGGCLENEILEIAKSSRAEMPIVHRFDTTREEDRLFGWQKGCSGTIDVLFESLSDASDDIDLYFPFGSEKKYEGVALSLTAESLGARTPLHSLSMGSSEEETLCEPWQQPVSVSVIGCGVDSFPFYKFCNELGWSIQFIDYRKDLVESHASGQAEYSTLDKIHSKVPAGDRSAVVLMTHNYEADLNIFATLVGKDLAFLGCLGPRRRYNLMVDDLRNLFDIGVDQSWQDKVVKAPPGVMSVNRSPVEVALSIVADIQRCMGDLGHG